MDSKQKIQSANTSLGIELGSTRIKGVLIDESGKCLASGGHTWESRLENGIWTYNLEDIWSGLQNCYRNLAKDVECKYGITLTTIGSIGFSAMMHGYMPFDHEGNLLTPFRTWRNTITCAAAEELTELFSFNIPQRWSISHLYQAILNGESHVKDIDFLTTLSGYIHWRMTGKKVLGIGDASGMFPIDSDSNSFDQEMLDKFDSLAAVKGFTSKLSDLLPKVLTAGMQAGALSDEGAKLLDPTGSLKAGIPICPPEGDADTGMTATNSVAVHSGNVSAGTSVFAMVVLEKHLSNVYPEIDMITTPDGSPVAMVHGNNCTNEIDAWASIFREVVQRMGVEVNMGKLYDTLYGCALEGDADCGGLLSYNYLSGEPITGFEQGRPLFVRTADSNFTLPNFMRAQLYSCVATMKLGMDILAKEKVRLDKLQGHGGLFKLPLPGQRAMAAATGVSICVMETAGEGGPWGMALLASYMKNQESGESLEKYLSDRIFSSSQCVIVSPVREDLQGFARFMERYEAGLAVERAAVDSL